MKEKNFLSEPLKMEEASMALSLYISSPFVPFLSPLHRIIFQDLHVGVKYSEGEERSGLRRHLFSSFQFTHSHLSSSRCKCLNTWGTLPKPKMGTRTCRPPKRPPARPPPSLPRLSSTRRFDQVHNSRVESNGATKSERAAPKAAPAAASSKGE